MEQGLEEVLRLALRLALLGAEPLEFVDDVGELLLVGEWGEGGELGGGEWVREVGEWAEVVHTEAGV